MRCFLLGPVQGTAALVVVAGQGVSLGFAFACHSAEPGRGSDRVRLLGQGDGVQAVVGVHGYTGPADQSLGPHFLVPGLGSKVHGVFGPPQGAVAVACFLGKPAAVFGEPGSEEERGNR